MKMKLRFSESEINYWANRYTERQREKDRVKEQQLIDLKSDVQERGYLTKIVRRFLFRYHTYTVFRMGTGKKQTQMKRIHFPGARTPQIRDAIIAAVGVNAAAEVTEAHLAALTILYVSESNITTLKPGQC